MSNDLVISDISDTDADAEPLQSPEAKSSSVTNDRLVTERNSSAKSPLRGSYLDRRDPVRSAGGWSLFLTQIHPEAKEEDVFDSFADFGNIRSICLNLDRRTGRLTGAGTIVFEKLENARKAKEKMHGNKILGKEISVDWTFVEGEYTSSRSMCLSNCYVA